VSDVAQTEATITVTPSDAHATYYYAAVKKAEFDTFESDAAYAQHILDNLQAIADKKVLSLSEYLATALVKGSTPQKITDLTAGTDYYAVALGMLTDGRFTSDLVKEAFKTDDAPEPAPELTLSMRAGDASGANTSSYVTCHIKSSDIVSAKAAFLMKSAVDNALAEGKTLADILAGVTNDPTLTAEQVEKINSADGYDLPCRGVPASTAVTAIVSVTSVNGKTTVDSASATTDAAQSGGDLTLSINVTDITATTAKVSVTSSDETSSYFFSVLSESLYAQLGSTPEGIAAFIPILWESYQEDYPSMTLPQILAQLLSIGNDSYDFDELTPGAKYYAFAIGVDATTGATTTSAVVKDFTTETGSGGDGPELTLTLRAGDANGANTDTKVYMGAYAPTATGAYYGLFLTSDVEKVLAQGASYDAIVTQNGTDMSTKEGWLEWLVTNPGIGVIFGGLDPGTSYTCILKVTDSAGKSTTKHVAATTEGGGEASDAYKAWLGTWTVTSTSSVYTKKPLTFDVVFKQKVANVSYSVEGWTASIFRDQPDESPYFPVATFNDGGFYFANGQTFGKFNLGEYGTGTLTYCCFFTLAGKNYYSSQTEFSDGTPFVSLYGTMNSDKQSAVVKGAEVEYSDGDAIMEYADFIYVLDSGQGAMGILPGEGFKYSTSAGEYTDSPIGPYTMVKKGSVTSALSAPSKSAVDMNAMPYAGKLSSVLSSRTAVAVTSPEQNGVVFESQVAMPISLVFDRPVALKAVIDNRGNFENAGLEKQISNNLDNNTDCQLLNRL
ncbi:MAG: hypothetical protein LUC96_06120, partial [Alistipes sp.]|uniref:hypothetical protein n=1 Tax=Alistipes sp. TaxID=1872444 RepID=UPI0025C56CA7